MCRTDYSTSANISEPWSQWTGPGIICAQVVIVCSGSSTGHTVLRGNFPSRASYTCQCAVGKCPRCYCEDNSSRHGLSMRACREEISSSVDTCVLWGNVLATQRCSCGDNSSQHGLTMSWRNILISTVMELCPRCCCGDNSSQHGLSMSWGNVLISCAMEKFPCCCCGDISSRHGLSMSWGNFLVSRLHLCCGEISSQPGVAVAEIFPHNTSWACREVISPSDHNLCYEEISRNPQLLLVQGNFFTTRCDHVVRKRPRDDAHFDMTPPPHCCTEIWVSTLST